MALVLEINDWQLTLYAESGEILYQEIAATALLNQSLVFGNQAWQQARINPQGFNCKYLSTINADPLNPEIAQAKNHADLIYYHLCALPIEPNESVVVLVPGHVSNDQLGIILGIAAEAHINISGFIDSALAQSLNHPSLSAIQASTQSAPSSPTTTQQYLLLDVELHRLTLSYLDLKLNTNLSPTTLDCLVGVSQTKTYDGNGLLHILDGWLNLLADDFVNKTRFDPMHAARSEQQLLDQVYAWCSNSEADATPALDPSHGQQLIDKRISIEHGAASHEVDVNHNQLVNKLAQRINKLDFLGDATLLLSHRVQAIPGLVEFAQQKANNIALLDQSQTIINTVELLEQLPEDQIARLTEANIIVINESSINETSINEKEKFSNRATETDRNSTANNGGLLNSESQQSVNNQPRVATHLLHQGMAVSLSDAVFKDIIDHSTGTYRILVEHNAVEPLATDAVKHISASPTDTQICVGDQIIVGDTAYDAIEVI